MKQPKTRQDISGKTFGKLTALRIDETRVGKSPYWIFQCQCGTTKGIRVDHVPAGRTTSCGCSPRGKITHGHTRYGLHPTAYSPTYQSWMSMKSRCCNPRNNRYERYGQRGITIHPDWMKFENFLRDMGERPENTSLERLNTDEGYAPGNCVWANKETQANLS